MSQGNQAPSATVLPGQQQAAGNVAGDIQSLTNPSAALQPYAYDQLLAFFNNPNIYQYMQGAQTAGQSATNAGYQANQSGNQLLQNAYALMQNAYDPQKKLYNQLQQQNQDQTNVMNSMYGLQSSPYGAGVANQSNQNFNINWQNQQLQRMLQANQGAGQDIGAANQLFGGAAQDFLSGGQLPYQAYNDVLGGGNNALSQYLGFAGQGNALSQNAIGDWLQYLGMGQSGVGLNQQAYGLNQQTAGNYGSFLMPYTTAGANYFMGNQGVTPQTPNFQNVSPIDTSGLNLQPQTLPTFPG